MMHDMSSQPDPGYLNALRSRLPVTARTHWITVHDLYEARREALINERSAQSKGRLQKVHEPQFRALRDEVKHHGRTKLDRNRLWVLWEAARNTARLPGAA